MGTTNVESATVTVEQAARILGLSRGTAYSMAASGELPGARRLRRRIVVSRKALEAFLEGRPE